MATTFNVQARVGLGTLHLVATFIWAVVGVMGMNLGNQHFEPVRADGSTTYHQFLAVSPPADFLLLLALSLFTLCSTFMDREGAMLLCFLSDLSSHKDPPHFQEPGNPMCS